MVRQVVVWLTSVFNWPLTRISEIHVSPHREFRYNGGWFWNRRTEGNFFGFPPSYKIQFFFDSSEFHLLDDCEYPCKFARNRDPTKNYEWCGFAFLIGGIDSVKLQTWAKSFRSAAWFTIGDDTPTGRKLGELVRTIRDES